MRPTGGMLRGLKFFRCAFLQALRLVHGQYQTARFELGPEGMTLFHSLPPVPPRGYAVQNLVKE